MFNPGELRKELLRVRLSYMAGVLFLICYPLASLGNEIAIDIMPVMYLVFGVAGLSVTHCLLTTKAKWYWVAFLYIGSISIILLIPRGTLVVAMIFSAIAFLDIVVNFRKRFINEC
jgi:hypothetical protein